MSPFLPPFLPPIEGTRRVLETMDHDTANQYLRFGWSLINQYTVEGTMEQPAGVVYVLASVRRLEDTRQIVVLSEPADVNEHLQQGWKLIDKHVVAEDSDRRHETVHFILVWQNEEPLPGTQRVLADDEIQVDLDANPEIEVDPEIIGEIEL